MELAELGAGVATDFFSDELKNVLASLKDRRAVQKFQKQLEQFEIEFEKAHDGSIATDGRFFSCLKSHRVMERIVEYVLDPKAENQTEEAFLQEVEGEIATALKRDADLTLSGGDRHLVRKFLGELLSRTREFSNGRLASGERALLYGLYQNHAGIKEVGDAVTQEAKELHRKLDGISWQLSGQMSGQMILQDGQVEEAWPEEFDGLIRKYNAGLRAARNRIDVYSMNKLDFDAVYVPPTLRLSEGPRSDFQSSKYFFEFMAPPARKMLWDRWLGSGRSAAEWENQFPNYVSDDPGFDSGGVPVANIFDLDEIVYIVGGAGYGKSLFLRNLEVNPDCLRGFQERSLLILSGDIKRLVRQDGTLKTMQSFLGECFANHSLAAPDEFAPEFLARCLSAGRCLILLDALDEVGNDQRDAIHSLMIDYFERYAPHNKVCITSRDRGFIPRRQIACFKIEPVTVEDVDHYVDRFIALDRFDREEKERFVEQASVLVERGFVKGFLTLSLLMAIYKNDRELPANKVLLYKKCFEYMANSREKGKKLLRNSETNELYDWKILGQFMQDATFMEMAQLGRPNNADIPQGKIEELLEEEYRHNFYNQGECQAAIEQFLQFCADRTEILVPSNDRNGFYRFYHRSFFEYFTARYISVHTHRVEDTYAALREFGTDSEVFELLAVLYIQENPRYLRELMNYLFDMVERGLEKGRQGFSVSMFDLNTLVLLMQVVNDVDLTRRFIVLFSTPEYHLNRARMDVSYDQIHVILNRNSEFLQKQLKENLKQLMGNIEYELIGFLSSTGSQCKDILTIIKKKKQGAVIRGGNESFTYSKLLAELPECDQLLEDCLNRFKSPKYLYGKKNLRNERAKSVLLYTTKILELSVKQRAQFYHAFMELG